MSALRTPGRERRAPPRPTARADRTRAARSHGISSCGIHDFVVARWRSNRRSTCGRQDVHQVAGARHRHARKPTYP